MAYEDPTETQSTACNELLKRMDEQLAQIVDLTTSLECSADRLKPEGCDDEASGEPKQAPQGFVSSMDARIDRLNDLRSRLEKVHGRFNRAI